MNSQSGYRKARGFTVVELAVVIVVIGLLATIGVASYRMMQDRTNTATMDTNLKGMNAAVLRYYSKNGSYPTTSGNWLYRAASGSDFIPGLVSGGYYTGDLPDVTTGSKTDNYNNTYIYRSNGTDYKLLRLHWQMPAGEMSNIDSKMIDPQRTTSAWGYWTPGGQGW